MKNLLIALLIMLRRGIYLTLGKIDLFLKRKNKLTIFSYHSVARDTWQFSINPEVVKKQITYLQKNYAIITLSDVELFLQGKKEITRPSVVLTFDDGYKDILLLKDFFIKNNITPTLFVLSDSTHANYKELDTKRPFLSSTEIKSLQKLGWEIGCHSGTHANLVKLAQSDLAQETKQAKATLEKSLGRSVSYFAYPRGMHSAQVVQSVKNANYTLGFTMDDAKITKNADRLTLPRVGVDRSHTFEEFKVTFSPSVIAFRQVIKTVLKYTKRLV